MKKNSLNAIVQYIARMTVACLLMMWGVINLVSNILAYQRAPDGIESDHWNVAIGLLVVLAVVPFLVGIFLLQRTMKAAQPKSRAVPKGDGKQ